MANIVKCLLCGDVIESTHRHDFNQCKCGNLFVDGGNDYQRLGVEYGWDSIKVISSPENTVISTPEDL